MPRPQDKSRRLWQFTIRDVFVGIVTISILLSWVLDHANLQHQNAKLQRDSNALKEVLEDAQDVLETDFAIVMEFHAKEDRFNLILDGDNMLISHSWWLDDDASLVRDLVDDGKDSNK